MTDEPSPRPWHIGESISGTMSCILFAADWRAGDPMRNRGAVLVRKLKQEIADEKAAKSRIGEGA